MVQKMYPFCLCDDIAPYCEKGTFSALLIRVLLRAKKVPFCISHEIDS